MPGPSGAGQEETQPGPEEAAVQPGLVEAAAQPGPEVRGSICEHPLSDVCHPQQKLSPSSYGVLQMPVGFPGMGLWMGLEAGTCEQAEEVRGSSCECPLSDVCHPQQKLSP